MTEVFKREFLEFVGFQFERLGIVERYRCIRPLCRHPVYQHTHNTMPYTRCSVRKPTRSTQTSFRMFRR